MAFNYTITGINPIKHSIDTPDDFVFLTDKDNLFTTTEFELKIEEENDVVDITVFFTLHWNKLNSDDRKTWIDIFSLCIQNSFLVQDVTSKLNPDTKELEEKVLRYLVNMSINHSRGIQSLYTKGTKLEGMYLPSLVFDPKEMEIIRTSVKS